VRNQAVLGEAPVWDPQRMCLVWVDIIGESIHFFDPDTNEDRVVRVGQPIGSVAPRKRGGLVAATSNGISVLASNGRLESLVGIALDTSRLRMNDGKCDLAGRYWTGTMALDHRTPDSCLYRIGADLKMTTMLTSIVVSNGLGWSPDNRKLYYNDTVARHIDMFDFDLITGAVQNRSHLVEFSERPGWPDGMAVDEQGYLWIAVWGGWSVRRYRPDGFLDSIVKLPVAKVTSCCFGGRNLTELYITTSRYELTDVELAQQPLAGSLFRFNPRVTGLPTGHFAG
jgi:sugar lactone lactonase YvrE